MKEYPKINSVYKRDEVTKKFLEGQWSEPEFEYLADNQWEWTEKVDGQNIRVIWTPEVPHAQETDSGEMKVVSEQGIVTFKGKQETSQMPTFLFSKLQQLFPAEKFKEHFKDVPICLYGEGYGKGIQKGKDYIPTGVSFILFDVWIEGWWLKRSDVIDVAQKLGIEVVPLVMYGTIHQAISMVRDGFESTWKCFQAEGLVGKTPLGLKNRKGERIITKVKTRDFVK